MPTARFRLIVAGGKELTFQNLDALHEGCRTGAVDADGLLHDMADDRWRIARNHPATRDVPPRPVAATPSPAPTPKATTSPSPGRATASTPRTPPAAAAQTSKPREATQPTTAGTTQAPASSGGVLSKWHYIAFAAAIVLVAIVRNSMENSGAPTKTQPAAALSAPREAVPDLILEGVVTNYGTPSARAREGLSGSLALRVHPPGGPPNELRIGSPLGGSGPVDLVVARDTMMAVSFSPTGDTILWFGTFRRGRLEGSYAILGGPYFEQGGRWWLRADRQAVLALQVQTAGRQPPASFRDLADLVRPFARRRLADAVPVPSIESSRDASPSRVRPPPPSSAAPLAAPLDAQPPGGFAPPNTGCMAGSRPVNGAILRAGRRGGLGRLVIDNQTTQDAVIEVVRHQGLLLARFYVRAHGTATLTSVPTGVYRVKFAQGDGWDTAGQRFCGAATFSQFDDLVDFEEVAEADGTTYSVNSFTLHRVTDGNASTTRINESQFWAE